MDVVERLVKQYDTSSLPQTHTWFKRVGKKPAFPFHMNDGNLLKVRKEIWKLVKSDVKDTKEWNSITTKVIKDKPFKMFVDLDWKAEKLVDFTDFTSDLQNNIKGVVLSIKECLEKVTNMTLSEWYVAVRMVYKVHIYFPQLIVTFETGKRLAEILQEHLESKFPTYPWDKVVDQSVYTTGLRWIWNHKGSMDSVAKAKKDKEDHVKLFDEKSFHECYYLVNPLTFEEIPPELKHLKLTDISTTETVNFVIDAKSKGQKSKQKKLTISSTTDEAVNSASQLSEQESLALTTFISNQYKFQPNQIKLNKALLKDKSIIIPIATNWCWFKNGEHGGNVHQYIVLNEYGISQRCHSEKLDTCKTGKHNFISFDKVQPSMQNFIKEKCSNDKPLTIEEVYSQIVPFTSTDSKDEDVIETSNKLDWTRGEFNEYHLGNYARLTKNLYCPCHKTYHDTPCNYLVVTLHSKTVAVHCDKEFSKHWPDPAWSISMSQLNVIFNNQVVHNHYYNNEDDMVDFGKRVSIFDDQQLNDLVFNSFSNIASDIAKVYHYLGKDQFAVSVDNTWWCWDFKCNRWKQTDHLARLFLTDIVSDVFKQARRWFANNTTDANLARKRDNRLTKIIERCGEAHIAILSTALALFKDTNDRFEEHLDTNKDLLCFENGVYDLGCGKFRPAKSTDYLTFSCGYEFPNKVEPEVRSLIMNFIQSIMPPDESTVRYLLKWLASCLDGYNREEIFTILTGSGRNGKGVLGTLLSKTFGDHANGYAYCVPSTLLTSDRPPSSSPTPDTLNLKGKRLVMTSEPEKGASINNGFVKFLTGNDMMTARGCHKNFIVSFYPQHSTILQCNSIPKLDGDDEAIWDRSRIIDFPYKFVSGDPVEPNQKKIDRELKSQVIKWGPQFMLLLLEWYKVYRAEGLDPPESVVKMSTEVRRDNDMLVQFLEKHYEKVDDASVYVLHSDMLELYSQKFKNGERRPKLTQAVKRWSGIEVNKHCGQRSGNNGASGYKGLRQRDTT